MGEMRKAAWLASKEGAEHFNAPFCGRQAEVHGNIKKETKRSDVSEMCFKLIQCREWDRDDVRLGHGSVVEAVSCTTDTNEEAGSLKYFLCFCIFQIVHANSWGEETRETLKKSKNVLYCRERV